MTQAVPISWGNGVPQVPVDHRAAAAGVPAAPAAWAWPEDKVELTGMTVREAIAKVDELRLAEIGRQIRAGTYFTKEKLDIVVERVCEMLRATVKPAASAG